MAVISIIYGRDTAAKEVTQLILELMGHSVRDFAVSRSDNPNRSFNKEIIDNLFVGADAAVVVFSPDEEGLLQVGLRGTEASDWELHDRLRPNVVLEFGLAVAKLDGKVIEVSFGFPYQEIPSDWLGLNPLTWSNSRTLARELSERLNAFGVKSQTPHPDKLLPIRYVPPEPDFEDSSPPYEFIKYPFKLRIADLNPPWPDQLQIYKDKHYEIMHGHMSGRASWTNEGWKPLIFKDYDMREYVLAGYEPVPGYGQHLWLGRPRKL
jgi:hypothetical protein